MAKCAVQADQTGSTKLMKSNTLRQFNFAQVLGVPTAAGMVPVIYPIWLHAKCPGGTRGIVFYGGTFDGHCDWYDQNKQIVDCETSFVYKYNGLEVIEDKEKKEKRFQRHKGYASMNFPKKKTFFKGEVMWKAPLTLKGCDNDSCCLGFPEPQESVEEAKLPAKKKIRTSAPDKKKTKVRSCNCGRK